MPKIYCNFCSTPQNIDNTIAHRAEAWIINDNHLKILFGARLTSSEKIQDTQHPQIEVLVEAIGTFQFEKKLPKIEKAKDIPFVENLLALIYPFLREKINDCFNANNALFLLSPINTYNLVEHLCSQQGSFVIADKRP